MKKIILIILILLTGFMAGIFTAIMNIKVENVENNALVRINCLNYSFDYYLEK